MTRDEAKQNTWRAHCNFDDPRKAIHIVIDQIFDEHDLEMKAKDEEIERLKEFEEMVEWMELNSNRSLCDYYNNKDNK